MHDSVDGKKRELNKEKLLSGVKQYLEDEDKPYNILVDAEDSVGCSKGVSGEAALRGCIISDEFDWEGD